MAIWKDIDEGVDTTVGLKISSASLNLTFGAVKVTLSFCEILSDVVAA